VGYCQNISAALLNQRTEQKSLIVQRPHSVLVKTLEDIFALKNANLLEGNWFGSNAEIQMLKPN